jgi:hypothetical protein
MLCANDAEVAYSAVYCTNGLSHAARNKTRAAITDSMCMHVWRANPAFVGFYRDLKLRWVACNMGRPWVRFPVFSTARPFLHFHELLIHMPSHTQRALRKAHLDDHRALGKATTGLMLLHIAVRETMIVSLIGSESQKPWLLLSELLQDKLTRRE